MIEFLYKVYKGFTPQQWSIMVAGAANATAGLAFLVWFFRSRYWLEMVINPVTQRVSTTDFGRASSLMLAHTGFAAVLVSKLAFNRDAGLEVLGLIGLLYTHAGFAQRERRIEKKDTKVAEVAKIAAANPTAPATTVEITESNVGIGPNGTQAAANESGPTFTA